MFLSIIIPTYNDEKHLSDCLDSCLSQNIPVEDYEIICVDDCSTDRTPSMLKEYEENNRNVHIILKEKHGGTGGRTMGFMASKGDYVWFVDHDDLITPNVLAELKDCILEEDCDRLVFPVYYFFRQLSDEEKSAKDEKTLKPNGAQFRNAIWASIIRKQFMLDHDIMPRTKKVPLDQPIWFGDGIFISECIRAGAREAEFNDCTVYFYRRGLSTQETADHSPERERVKIKGLVNYAAAVKRDYETEVHENGEAKSITANHYLQWVRTATANIAPLPRKLYIEGIAELENAGIFPMTRPKECTYLAGDCIRNNHKNGMNALKSILYYYSYTRVGMFLYRSSFVKTHLKRMLVKAKLISP